MNMKTKHIIFFGYIAASIALLLFSYTQVDLNLTLSRSSVVQTVEKAFQHVGYYQRPLAAGMYIGILFLLFALYGMVLSAVKRNTLNQRDVWRIVFLVAAIVVFSYPAAFSYDFFNYMFTAKTVLVYHQNPYVVTPLLFSGVDPWTNFMRWTHLTTAYAPLWIGMTLVPYILGFGYFVPTLFAMKGMVAGWYLLCAWAVGKVVEKTDAGNAALGLAVFALNPLILAESLVSAHNDVVLSAFAMLAVWAYVSKDRWSAWLWLAFSIAAKTVTIVLIPVLLLRRSIHWMVIAMFVVLGLVLLKREFLPWYWVWIVPFVAVLPIHTKLTRFAAIVSFGLLVSYAPYLYFGEYNATEQWWKSPCILAGVALALLSALLPVSAATAPRRQVPAPR